MISLEQLDDRMSLLYFAKRKQVESIWVTTTVFASYFFTKVAFCGEISMISWIRVGPFAALSLMQVWFYAV